ncbi:MAG: oligosaccharide flippase family protein [Nanoarchaeota archaeon]
MTSKDLNSLAKGTSINLIFAIFASITTLIFNILAANYFGPENFGFFSLVETILGLSIMLAGLGITNSILRYFTYYRETSKAKLKGYMEFIFLIPLSLSFVVGILLFIFSGHITNFFNFPSIFSKFIQIIAIIIPFRMFSQITGKLFLSNKMYLHTNISFNVINKLSLIVGILLIIYFNLEIIILIYLLLIIAIIRFTYSFIIFVLYKDKFLIKEKEKKKEYKNWFLFSLPLFFSGFMSFVYNWGDKIIIAKFLSPTELGIYSVAFSMAMFLYTIRSNMTNIFSPIISQKFAQKNYEEIKYLYKKGTNWIFSLTLPIFLVIIVFSKQIILLLYDKSYINAYIPLMIISIGLLINIMFGLNQQILFAKGKTKSIFYNNIFIAGFNLILNLILIPLIGIIGAAIATSISFILQNSLLYIKANKHISLKLDWIYYLKCFIAGVPSVLLGAIVYRILDINKYFDLVLGGGVYMGLFIFLLFILKIFDKEDIKILILIEKKLGVNLGFVKRILKRFI